MLSFEDYSFSEVWARTRSLPVVTSSLFSFAIEETGAFGKCLTHSIQLETDPTLMPAQDRMLRGELQRVAQGPQIVQDLCANTRKMFGFRRPPRRPEPNSALAYAKLVVTWHSTRTKSQGCRGPLRRACGRPESARQALSERLVDMAI